MARDETGTIRHCLRVATRDLHDRLDHSVAAHGIGEPIGYGRFLAFQYAARLPVEAWFDAREGIGAPPRQTGMIAADLAELGQSVPTPHSGDLDPAADALAVAWVVAGSSLGNRAMLAQQRRAGVTLPTRFLADESMTEYWHSLRPRLQTSATTVDIDHMIASARAVFALFASRVDGAKEALAA